MDWMPNDRVKAAKERARARKEAIESGDATGGVQSRNADAIREELGSSKDIAKNKEVDEANAAKRRRAAREKMFRDAARK